MTWEGRRRLPKALFSGTALCALAAAPQRRGGTPRYYTAEPRSFVGCAGPRSPPARAAPALVLRGCARRAGGRRQETTSTPAAVEELASAEFLRRMRDGGPQAMQTEGLPEVEAQWVAEEARDTARNVVNALCRHRFGDKVCVDEVFAGPPAAKGTEFIVTLSLADRGALGSASSGQVQSFDRDTTTLLEQLKEKLGWKLGIYRLKVQTPGVEEELRSLDELWKCGLFPCYVEWVRGTSRYSRYLALDRNRTTENATLWRLADCQENHGKTGRLSAKQRSLEFEILPEEFVKVRTHLDKTSHSRVTKAREVLRKARAAAQVDDGE